MQGQLLTNPLHEADLTVNSNSYFGASTQAHLDNASRWGLRDGDGPLTRTSYVYQAVYQIGSGKDKEYGGIQLRGRVHTYGPADDRLEAALETAAHRAAYMYDSGIQTPSYGPPPADTRGTDDNDGYLSGFNSVESYRNWEREQISPREMQTEVGVIDWSTEVYTDDSFDDAELSGIAQGIADPWDTEVTSDPGRQARNIAPHKWGLSYNESRGQYDVHPPGRKAARDRYKPGGAGHDKTVYINDRPVGKLDANGRTWLQTEYAGNPNKTSGGFGTYYSREGLVDQTGATYSALSDGGVLYLTGESEDRIDLVTAAEKPPGYTPADPDSVSSTLRVQDGSQPVERRYLRLRDLGTGADEPVLRVECRRDQKLIKHMGRSNPRYSHWLTPSQNWRGASSGLGRAER